MGIIGGPALALLALAPQVVNTFATSFPLERRQALDHEVLHLLHELRPALDATTVAAAVGLLTGRATGAFKPGALLAGLGGALLLRAVAQLITAQPAHPAYAGAITVLPAAHAELSAFAEVVGVVVNGQARCYPLALLIKPATLSDTLGGVPIATTFCPTSRAALALHDDWGGKRLGLQAVGAPDNDLALYAQAPRGVVSQLRARIMTGAHAGTPLRSYPAHRTSWAHWRTLHPATTVGVWPTGWQGAYDELLIRSAMATDATSAEPLYATRHLDRRLPLKTPVLGIGAGGRFTAIPRAALPRSGEVQLVVGEEPVVVVVADDIATALSARDGRPTELSVDRVWWHAWAAAHPETGITRPTPATTPGQPAMRLGALG